ncbi:potassium-transporting ATPase subunit C [Pokkaliibacter plantistimulans]|uniref:Potassium-transporting ATPase KdpC subunit n=1 Tax=Proteobacteria bacterium 228 TaxID=2083153 RepID=A0A2S5KWL2_9PROT|nr:potassium-transporting ATPase subunit KdpC [Pokkaliibacter plantistimulans]PPC79244.1 potassium-transporting ATPase subunit C [Pokkaliibacter plantistimulans]
MTTHTPCEQNPTSEAVAAQTTIEHSSCWHSAIKTAFALWLLATVVCGLAYPLLMTGIGQLLFPWQSNGSLLFDSQHRLRGSALLGQQFSTAGYFHGRPSASDYKSGAASNLAQSNPALVAEIRQRYAYWHQQRPDQPVPSQLVYASASGLDPEIDLSTALYQAPLVAAARQVPVADVEALVQQLAQHAGREEPIVNVLQLNMALDTAKLLSVR